MKTDRLVRDKILIEGYYQIVGVRKLYELLVIGSYARRSDDKELWAERKKDIGFEDALDNYNLCVEREIGRPKFEMERAARTAPVPEIGRGEPEITTAFFCGQRQSHLASLNSSSFIAHGNY
jgi:hypothetical protein